MKRKKYVECKCHGLLNGETIIKEIEEYYPYLQMDTSNRTIGVRFFEMNAEDDFYDISKRKKQTNWIYFGNRVTLDNIEFYPNSAEINKFMQMYNLSAVCLTRYNDIIPMLEGDLTYTENYIIENYDQNILKEFKDLEKNIGEMVTIYYWCYGHKIKDKEKLVGVNYYSSITTSSKTIPLIANHLAVTKIKLNKDGKILYYNPYLEEGYDYKTVEELNEIKRKFYGVKVASKQEKRRNKKQELITAEISKPKQFKNKYELMQAGLKYITEDKIVTWFEFVDSYANEANTINIIADCLIGLEKFQNNAAELDLYCRNFECYEFMYTIISYFSKNSHELREYWHKNYGYINEVKEKTTNHPITLNRVK